MNISKQEACYLNDRLFFIDKYIRKYIFYSIIMIRNSRNKKERVIKLTERQLSNIVRESVTAILESNFELAVDDEDMALWRDRPEYLKALRTDMDDIMGSDMGRFVKRSSSAEEYSIYKFTIDVVDEYDEEINLLHPDENPWPIFFKYGVDPNELKDVYMSDINGVKQMFSMNKLNKDRMNAVAIRELIDANANIEELKNYLEENEVLANIDGDIVRIYIRINQPEEIMKSKEDIKRIPNSKWIDPVNDKSTLAKWFRQ